MGNLYKRIVTMGMISFTAVLAFLYCILVYRTEATYVVAASLVTVGSIYALLLALVDLKIKKDEEAKQFAEEKLKEFMVAQNKSDELITVERLLKASYVQQRKTNTRLAELTEETQRIAQESQDNDKAITEDLQRQMTDVINKAMKIMVKYSQNDNEKILGTMREMSAYITTMSADVDKLAKELDNITAEIKSIEFSPVINVAGTVAAPAENVMVATTDDTKTDDINLATTAADENLDDVDISGFDAEAFLSSFESSDYTDNESVNNIVSSEEDEIATETDEMKEVVEESKEEPVADVSNDDPNQLLSQDAIAALFAAANPESTQDADDNDTDTDAQNNNPDDSQNDVSSTPDTNDDPNRQLSPEEIAAMFEASKDERRAKSDDDFKVFEHPDAMDQSLIDALLGNISDDEDALEVHDVEKESVEELTTENENLADVIPFPTRDAAEESTEESTEKSTEEEPVAEEKPVVEEPVAVAPVDDNPNRQLSPEEIAALFAAADTPKEEPKVEEPIAEEKPVVEEPVAVTPVDDNPNRQLSPEEIAALFAAADTPKEEPKVEESVAEEPIAVTPVDDNPNRQLSPDEIAALFASVQ